MKDWFGNNVSFASTTTVDTYRPQIDRLLTGIGFENTRQVFVSDLSTFSDFHGKIDDADLLRLSEEIQVALTWKMKLVYAAARMETV